MHAVTNRTHANTQPFILIRNGQRIVYQIHEARIVLRRRGGVWLKYLVGRLPSGVRFEASYGRAAPAEVRRWTHDHPTHRAAANALHALADRLAEAIGLHRALALFVHAVSTAEGVA
jgi:hypothetical protein